MEPLSSPEPLLNRLLDRLDRTSAIDLQTALVQYGKADEVYELLEELVEASSKVSSEAVWAMPEYRNRCGLDTLTAWLDLGITLTQTSGATGLRYFKESFLVLGLLDSENIRSQVLGLTLELADGASPVAPNCAFEFLKQTPELLMVVPISELEGWAEIGMDLSQWDYVLGNEFLRESPSIARVVSLDHVRSWVGFGMKLMTQNTLGKPDYLGTLEFFRRSPTLLGEIPESEVRQLVVDLGSVMADRSPQVAMTFLADSPVLLRAFPSLDWRIRVLKYGLLVTDQDAEATLAFLRRASEVLHMSNGAEDALPVFESWFQGGMEVLQYSLEGGRAYFAIETRKALASVERAMSGVPLRQVSRSLKLFAQGMCGADITIEALPDSGKITPEDQFGHAPSEQNIPKATVSSDGKTLYLPSLLRQGSTREDNFRLYTVMTAHEVGHLEFGTYRVGRDYLQQLVNIVQARYGRGSQGEVIEEIQTLGDVFPLYPQQGVIRDLWEILEDARVEFLLQEEYPGLRADLAYLTREAVKTRSLLHGMTAREMVLDALLLRFAGVSSHENIPEPLEAIVGRVWSIAETILRPSATADEAVLLADRLYQVLDEMIGHLGESDQRGSSGDGPEQSEDVGAGPRAAEEISAQYRPITNWAFRGALDPNLVQGHTSGDEELSTMQEMRMKDDQLGGSPPQGLQDRRETQTGSGPPEMVELPQEGGSTSLEQSLQLEDTLKNRKPFQYGNQQQVLYDEWDGTIQDYRPRWCRVRERIGPEGTHDFIDQTLAAHAPVIRLLRRYFEAIRPTAFRRLGRQENGEDIDLDAVVRWVADRRIGRDPSDRVYFRREKRERQVAVAFVIDMSGSTGRQIGPGQRRVIDVEKEGLLLLSEALSAIGDQYALYGYSGQGRHQVDVVVLKAFEEASMGRAALRIGAIQPRQQNRDGAVIRHVAHRLLQQPARTRLLILISDGKPLDDGYGDEYSLEDTKMALREVRVKGIHPFCITVDQSASDYLKRMYGEIGFLVIDDIRTLPGRLPRIYQRLTA